MRLEWDQEKNRRNRARHKVSFETAGLVFGDPHAQSIEDREVEAEQRWWTNGPCWRGAAHRRSHVFKKSLTIRLDADVVAWLKSQGKGYQTRINSLLREAMENRVPR